MLKEHPNHHDIRLEMEIEFSAESNKFRPTPIKYEKTKFERMIESVKLHTTWLIVIRVLCDYNAPPTTRVAKMCSTLNFAI